MDLSRDDRLSLRLWRNIRCRNGQGGSLPSGLSIRIRCRLVKTYQSLARIGLSTVSHCHEQRPALVHLEQVSAVLAAGVFERKLQVGGEAEIAGQ